MDGPYINFSMEEQGYNSRNPFAKCGALYCSFCKYLVPNKSIVCPRCNHEIGGNVFTCNCSSCNIPEREIYFKAKVKAKAKINKQKDIFLATLKMNGTIIHLG